LEHELTFSSLVEDEGLSGTVLQQKLPYLERRAALTTSRVPDKLGSRLVSKSIVLGTALPRRAEARKRAASLDLPGLIRCGIPLSGGGSAENETQFRFRDAEMPTGRAFAKHFWGETGG
jgi:hypothetical protein